MRASSLFLSSLLLGLMLGQAAWGADASVYVEPPKADYAKLCQIPAIQTLTPPPGLTVETAGSLKRTPRELYQLGALYLSGNAKVRRDPAIARKLFERLAETPGPQQGPTLFQLGKAYVSGDNQTQDAEKGVALLERAAKLRAYGAGFALGQYYEETDQPGKALDAYKLGAAADDPSAMFGIGSLYRSERVPAPTPEAALEMVKHGEDNLLTRLAKGDCGAAGQMGFLYLDLNSAFPNDALALRWYEVAQHARNPETIMTLAALRQRQSQPGSDQASVFELWQRAAELGSDKGLLRVGQSYLLGDVVPKDLGKAVHYLEESALRQNVEAMRQLADIYHGNYGGTPDYAKEAQWLVRAAAHPKARAESAYKIGEMYENGRGVARDYVKADQYYELASNMGSNVAPLRLALFRQIGLGMDARPRAALRFLRLGSSRGNRDAMMAMYDTYECGIAVPYEAKMSRRWLMRAYANQSVDAALTLYGHYINSPDEKERVKASAYLQHAVDIGSPKAMVALARDYDSGNAVSRDKSKAKQLLADAVAPGEKRAEGLTALSDLYLDGLVVPYDPVKAAAMLEEAAKSGLPEAERKLGRLLIGNKYDIPADAARGVALLEKAGNEDDSQAMLALAGYYRSLGTPEGKTRAVPWYERAAIAGEIDAVIELSNAYRADGWLPTDPAKADEWMRLATSPQSCDMRKNVIVAKAYDGGLGLPKDEAKAKEWFDRAIRKKPATDLKDIIVLAEAYDQGYGTEANPKEAVALYEQAARRKDSGSMRRLASFYLAGNGVKRNVDTAVDWLDKASAQGDAQATLQLATLYDEGRDLRKNNGKAEEYYVKAANLGASQAARRLAERAMAAKDYAGAVRWYEMLAKRGDIGAIFSLVAVYSDPAAPIRDPAKAAGWFKQATTLADRRPNDMLKLGNMYLKGNGVKADPKEALRWFTKAAEEGNAGAMHQVGRMYEKGIVVAANQKEALAWYDRAASLGDASAMTELGNAYISGSGVGQDSQRALGYFTMAAQRGSTTAMRQLGLQYMRGNGVKQNLSTGFDWLSRAAERGDLRAMEEIAQSYSAGFGVVESPQKALEWWQRAANAGSKNAQEQLAAAKATGYGTEKVK